MTTFDKLDFGRSDNELSEKKWSIVSVASIPLIMTLGNSMLIPVLPLMEQKLDITKLQSSLIITVYSIVAIFLIPVAGFLSDKYGRKIVIIPSLIIAGIGGLISGWAAWKLDSPYISILIGRIFQGIGAAGAFPIVLPLIGDMFKRDKDVSVTLGVVETSNTFGKVLSPIMGSFLAGFLWFLPFLSIPVFSLISVLLIVFLVKKPKNDQHELSFGRFIKSIKKIFSEHWQWLTAVFIIGASLMFVLFGMLFYLSSVLEDDYGFDGVKKGLLLAIPLASLCVASFTSGKWIKDNLQKMKWISFFGIVLMGVMIMCALLSTGFIFLITIFSICGVGLGAALPSLDAILTQSIEKEMRGTITSIFSSMRFAGVAAGPPVIAVMMDQGIKGMIFLLTGLSAVSAILAFKAIRPEKEKKAPGTNPALE
ncbi:MFS transporter [Siminovitchia fordii]|uniref:Multidrug resistance protein n=1 Tax=Siminovitchia fordii TaxID=254759 RepID=A0ABQ4K808_9BACI|nr:MFS transporter [Siminovitchia fordii]GIN21315.1 multidrug resistance protein [Siminovitchia fordii]